MKENIRSNRYDKYNKILSEIPFEKLNKYGDIDREYAESQFREFKANLGRGICFYCNQNIESFLSDRPCFHWLLNPKGFKKKFFPTLYAKYGFHQLETYLRWLANTETPVRNINDLDIEKNPSKKIELTIIYKNMEWSFSCSNGDYEGHKDKYEGSYPHYHFQMKSNGRVIINYGGFHIPFSDYDEFVFAVKQGDIERLKYAHSFGAGMQSLMDRMTPEKMLGGMKNSDNVIEKDQFHLSTYIEADPGTTISGDEIADLIKESKATGEPLAKLAQKIKNVRITTVITPGPGIPEISNRKSRKRNR
jgi:hypothetical protein